MKTNKQAMYRQACKNLQQEQLEIITNDKLFTLEIYTFLAVDKAEFITLL